MIEKIVLDYLSSIVDVPVYMEVPEKNIPKKYILIEKIGSSMTNHIYNASIAIQSYADSLLEAAYLNDEVIKAMLDIVTLKEVSASNLNSDYNFTDTSTKQYRYQALFDLVHY